MEPVKDVILVGELLDLVNLVAANELKQLDAVERPTTRHACAERVEDMVPKGVGHATTAKVDERCAVCCFMGLLCSVFESCSGFCCFAVAILRFIDVALFQLPLPCFYRVVVMLFVSSHSLQMRFV